MSEEKRKAPNMSIDTIITYITKNNVSKKDIIIFEENKSKLKSYLRYVFEYVFHMPNMIIYLNKYNNLYDNNDPIQLLKWFRYVFTENKISKMDLKNSFFNLNKALQDIKNIEEYASKNKRQFNDVHCELQLQKIFTGKDIKKQEKKIVNDNSKKEKVINAIENYKTIKENKKKEKLENQGLFLKELNEEIIKKLELTIIDTYVIKHKNQVVYIFIDKNYQKKYYIEPFEASFYFSQQSGIINNDYIEDITDDKFIEYKITNIYDFDNLKKAINKNYKDFMKQ